MLHAVCSRQGRIFCTWSLLLYSLCTVICLNFVTNCSQRRGLLHVCSFAGLDFFLLIYPFEKFYLLFASSRCPMLGQHRGMLRADLLYVCRSEPGRFKLCHERFSSFCCCLTSARHPRQQKLLVALCIEVWSKGP